MGAEPKIGMLDMPSDEYFVLPQVSQSFLKLYLESPFHAHHPRNRETTKDQQFGTEFHCLQLEPDQYPLRYVEEPIFHFDGRKPEGKAERESFKNWANGRTLVSTADKKIQQNMVEATMSDSVASQLFCKGSAEKVLIWQDEIDGIWCKARLDWLPETIENLITDVKTTRSANPNYLRKSVGDWGYHIQDAFYRRGWKAVFGKEPDFVFSFHEKPKSPQDVAVPPVLIELDRQYRMAGERAVVRLLELHSKCVQENHWPSYTSGITLLSPPAWFKD